MVNWSFGARWFGSGGPLSNKKPFITKIPSKPPVPQSTTNVEVSFHVTKAWLPSGISLSLALLVFLMNVEAWRTCLNLIPVETDA